MKYNKRYKIVNVMVNKQLKNDEIVLKLISSGSKNPKPPCKTLDERIAEAVSKALAPVITRLDKIETFNVKVQEYMDKHP